MPGKSGSSTTPHRAPAHATSGASKRQRPESDDEDGDTLDTLLATPGDEEAIVVSPFRGKAKVTPPHPTHPHPDQLIQTD